MTQTLIEQLEALECELLGDGAFAELYVKRDDLRAIIEDYKSNPPREQAKAETKPLPICNLWVNPENFNYEVDHCTHPLDELIPVYTSPQPSHTKLISELVEALEKVKPAVVCASDYYYDKPIMTLAIKYNEMLSDIDALITKAREAVKHE